MKKIIYLILLIALTLNAKSQDASMDIMKTLETFKIGYEQRDTSKINEWFDAIFYNDVEVIGTYAIEPQKKEWKNNKEESRKLFKSDWVNWGDLTVDLSKVSIHYKDNFAWVNFPAIVNRNPQNSSGKTDKESYSNMLKNFEKIVINKESEMDEELKLHLIAYYANLVLYQYTKGEEYIWPIRISGVLQKEYDTWKFKQIHYSYPNRGFPNVRY